MGRNTFVSPQEEMRRKVTWTDDVRYAMTPLRLLTWPVGIWPLQDYNVFSLVRTTVSASFLFVMIATLAMEVILNENDTDKSIDCLMILSCGILAFSKVIWFRIHARYLIVNFTLALEDYSTIDSEEKRSIVRRHALMSRVACASLILFSYFGAISLTSDALMADNVANATIDALEYPVPTSSTLAYLNVPENWYKMIFVTHVLMLIICCHGNLGSDGMFFGIVFHVCGQVELLKNEFKRFTATTEKTLERFGSLTVRHRDLLNRTEKLARVINFMLIIQLFISCLLICIIGFQCILALKYKDVAMIGKTIAVMGTLMSQLFAYSYVGDYLKCQMEDLGHAVYFSGWYNFPTKVAKNIVFVLMRGQQPVQLKAGQFFVVNMQTYMNIVRTSLSYLSVLRVMINDE